jgi:hypothetical protein
MSHTLTLHVPAETYEPLERLARSLGQTPESLAVQWLSAVSHSAAHDPLEEFLGAFGDGPQNWADEHDRYLGEQAGGS